MTKVKVLVVVVAMLAIMVASASPASAKKAQCYTFDADDWYLVTGMRSEYGGTICHR
jgi:hypothetical protein